MTMQVITKLSALNGLLKDKQAWIVGCGPSLDAYSDRDIEQMRDHNIIALNSAITMFNPRIFKNVYWLYRDIRLVNEVVPRIKDWRNFRIITHTRGYNNFADQVAVKQKNVRAYLYPKDSVIHKRTIAEDALQIAKLVGLEAVYLLGVDHRVVNNQPYAHRFKWKECYFYNPKKPPAGGTTIPITAMYEAMQDLAPDLEPMQVRTCTEGYPGECFLHIGFKRACGRIDASNAEPANRRVW